MVKALGDTGLHMLTVIAMAAIMLGLLGPLNVSLVAVSQANDGKQFRMQLQSL